MAKKLLTVRVNELATAVGTDIKLINNRTGQLSDLTTDFGTNSANTSLVAAINYALNTAKQAQAASGATINDTSISDTTTYSSSKINTDINTKVAAKFAEILGVGTPEKFDTLKEVADYLVSNESAVTAITNKVPFDEIKTLTDEQKQNVHSTLGIGSMDEDFVVAYNAAKS